MGLEFLESEHAYLLDGKRVPSVTQVIREILAPDEYAGVSREVLDHAANRGRAVDRMIELDLAGELAPESLHPELLPYWRAWQAFPDRQAWANLEPVCQGQVFSAPYGYAGTFDILLRSDDVLIDVKATALVPRTVGVQTAAYAIAMTRSNSCGDLKRFCLHVTPTGCKLIRLPHTGDSADFLAALRVYHWRHRHDA